MADVVELMDFWPMDDDENIGFVAADSDFQLWLIAGIGVGFDDISYSVIDGPDGSGIYELIMDFEDYMNLADLYSEYLETGWAGLEEEDFDEVFAAPSNKMIHVTFKIQDADYATFYHTTLAPSGLSDEEIVDYTFGRNEANEDDEWFYIPSDWDGVGEHYLAKIMSKSTALDSEEGSTPVMDPMEFGEPVNWTPMDGTPSLKRRKDAESTGYGDASGYVTYSWSWEMTHPEDYDPSEWDINDELKKAAQEGETGWYSFTHDGHEVEAYITIQDPSFSAESSFMTPDLLWENLGGWWKAVGINPDYDMGQSQGQQQTGGGAAAGSGEGGESEGQAQQEQEQEQEGHRGHGDSSQPVSPYAAEGSGEINIGPVYVTKKVPVLFKHDYVTRDYEWSTDEPTYLTDDQESELVEIVEQIVEDSDEEEGDETFDEYDYQGEVSWDTYKDDGRFYDLGAEGANPSAESDVYYSVHLETLDGDTVWGGEYYLADYQNEKGLLEEAEFDLNYAEPAWKVATITKNGKVVKKIEYEAESFEARAESANPTGGATGDQIIAWEHNGLSSPSGPPSDIFWSEGDYGEYLQIGEYVQIFDTTITKKGIEEKLQRAGIKPIEVFSVYEDGTKSKDIFGVYLKEGDATAFSKEFNKNDWTGLFDFEGAVSFAAHMGHSRFQKSNNPRLDIGPTRRKLKQEMFSDVSGVVTLKNMAILGLAGITGYLIAGRN